MSTTKDKVDDTTNVPTTAPDMEENEDRDVELEQKYIIQVKDNTLDNHKVQEDGSIKDSNKFRQ